MSTAADETIHSLRYREVRKVTLIGSLVDFLLGIAKILVGWLAHSQALIADGVHSLSDLATDFIVLYAGKRMKITLTATDVSRRWLQSVWVSR